MTRLSGYRSAQRQSASGVGRQRHPPRRLAPRRRHPHVEAQPVEAPRPRPLPPPGHVRGDRAVGHRPARRAGDRPPACRVRASCIVQRDAAGAAGQRLGRHQHAGGVAAFDDPLQAQPRGVGDAAQRRLRHVGHVDHHHRAHARLQHQVERLQRAIDGALHHRAGPVDRAHAGQPHRDPPPRPSSRWPGRAPTAGDRDRGRRPPPTPGRSGRRCR